MKSIAPTEEIETSATKYSEWMICSIKMKADINKNRARVFGILSVILSSCVVFSLMFDGYSVPSVIAAILTITNSAILAWIQLEKPHDRWRLYRKYHRIIESERLLFLNRLCPYNTEDSDKIFISKLAELQNRLHNEWDGLIPSYEDISRLQKGN